MTSTVSPVMRQRGFVPPLRFLGARDAARALADKFTRVVSGLPH